MGGADQAAPDEEGAVSGLTRAAEGVRAVMITVPEREPVRQETLAQLRAADIYPAVSVQDSRERSNRAHALHCLWAIRGDRPILLVEDDLEVNPALLRGVVPQALEAAETEATACWLFLPGDRHYPAPLRRRPPTCPPIFQVRNLRSLYGSQAVVISSRVVRELEDAWPERNVGFDVVLRDHLVGCGRRPLAVTPNPVQHRAGPSTIPRHRAGQSTTYVPWRAAA